MLLKQLNCVTNVTRYKINIQKKYFSKFEDNFYVMQLPVPFTISTALGLKKYLRERDYFQLMAECLERFKKTYFEEVKNNKDIIYIVVSFNVEKATKLKLGKRSNINSGLPILLLPNMNTRLDFEKHFEDYFEKIVLQLEMYKENIVNEFNYREDEICIYFSYHFHDRVLQYKLVNQNDLDDKKNHESNKFFWINMYIPFSIQTSLELQEYFKDIKKFANYELPNGEPIPGPTHIQIRGPLILYGKDDVGYLRHDLPSDNFTIFEVEAYLKDPDFFKYMATLLADVKKKTLELQSNDPEFIARNMILETINYPSIKKAFIEIAEILRYCNVEQIQRNSILTNRLKHYYTEINFFEKKDLRIKEKLTLYLKLIDVEKIKFVEQFQDL